MYYIAVRYIALNSCGRKSMDAHIRKVYMPMTETGFYILMCLRQEMHGYNILKKL